MSEPGPEVTTLLKRWRAGDPVAEAQLFELVLPDLRRLAGYFMQKERAGHTLQASALLNETYIRLAGAKDQDWQNRRHFFAVAARAMRRCLVDYARARPAVTFQPLEDKGSGLLERAPSLELAVAVDVLLSELEKTHPEQCAIVELKFFLGFTDEETAEVLDLKLRSMQRSWQAAREWLYQRLNATKKESIQTTDS
jgi:RNA polymerase sigma factor (TIGR02999 family)